MNKKGISLVTLIITIVLVIILLSITTAGIGDGIQNARMASFGNDLAVLEDAVDTYYIQNGNFPVLEENGKYVEYVYNNDKLSATTGESISLNADYLNEFKAELVKNFDLTEGENVVSDTVFYKIDLAKLGVTEIKRGTGEDGENDIFVMAYPSQTIYYLKGLKVADSVYFSLINISDVKKVENPDSEVVTQTEEGITVTKAKKAWTNTLGINISASLTSNEKLYVKLPVRETEIELSTTTGENNISINSLGSSLSMTEAEVTAFNSLEISAKIMTVIKRTDGVETANIKVNIANYETEAPTFPLKEDGVTFDFAITSNDGYNVVSYTGSDSISGVKEVRYVYLTEFGANYIPNSLYEDTNTLTPDYMLQNGKKAYVSNDEKVEIKLPKDVEAIYITMYDKAGNSVSMQKNVATDIYVGINTVNISNNLKFNIGIKGTNEITSVKAWISLNGTDFIDEKDLTLTKNDNNIYTSTIEFENAQNKEVYIKMVAYDNANPQNVETRIKKINLEEIAAELVSLAMPGNTYEENRWYRDINGDKAIVPAGFRVSTQTDEQIIDDGLVIIDKNDNEFVWVPCTTDENDTSKVLYTKRFDEYPKTTNITSVSDDADAVPVEDETLQITKYGGFYIGRYESGVPANQITITGASVSTSNTTGTPIIQNGATAWTYIDYENANISAKMLYDLDNVKSGLITGTQWDTVMKWVEKSGISVNDSTTWGNHSDSSSPANVEGYGSKQVTGYSEYWKAKNIYDLAGNIYEWTGEIYSDFYIYRSGSYMYSGSESIRTVAGRIANNGSFVNVGFRIALYII